MCFCTGCPDITFCRWRSTTFMMANIAMRSFMDRICKIRFYRILQFPSHGSRPADMSRPQWSRQFGDNLLPMGKQESSLRSTLLRSGSAKYRIECLRHIGVFDDFLIIYPSLRISYWLINMEDEDLPFPGSDFFEPITASPNSTWRVIFQLSTFLVLLLWLASRHRFGDHVPAAVRRFVRFPDASRHSHSYSKHRYSHSYWHTAIRIALFVNSIDHINGPYFGNSTVCKVTGFNRQNR